MFDSLKTRVSNHREDVKRNRDRRRAIARGKALVMQQQRDAAEKIGRIQLQREAEAERQAQIAAIEAEIAALQEEKEEVKTEDDPKEDTPAFQIVSGQGLDELRKMLTRIGPDGAAQGQPMMMISPEDAEQAVRLILASRLAGTSEDPSNVSIVPNLTVVPENDTTEGGE